ncbi:hypothetical protein ACQP3D_28680, partial [Escherichia coli]
IQKLGLLKKRDPARESYPHELAKNKYIPNSSNRRKDKPRTKTRNILFELKHDMSGEAMRTGAIA